MRRKYRTVELKGRKLKCKHLKAFKTSFGKKYCPMCGRNV